MCVLKNVRYQYLLCVIHCDFLDSQYMEDSAEAKAMDAFRLNKDELKVCIFAHLHIKIIIIAFPFPI